MKFKYAASASFYTCPPVADILHSCDMIWTSNVDARDEICGAFGSHKVHFIPGFLLTRDAVRKSIENGDDVQWIEYGDLFKVFKHWVSKEATGRELDPWFSYFGYYPGDDHCYYLKSGDRLWRSRTEVLNEIRNRFCDVR